MRRGEAGGGIIYAFIVCVAVRRCDIAPSGRDASPLHLSFFYACISTVASRHFKFLATPRSHSPIHPIRRIPSLALLPFCLYSSTRTWAFASAVRQAPAIRGALQGRRVLRGRMSARICPEKAT